MNGFQDMPEKHASGAKARVDDIGIMRGLKPPPPSGTFWIKGLQALALVVAICFTLGASDAGSRFTNLNHRLMCTCGCAEILGECNHVGCTASTEELNDLRAYIAQGLSDDQILSAFAAKYGATVLAAPTTHGFDLVAWVAPFAVFAAALLGTILLVRRWSVGKTLTEAGVSDPATEALKEKIRRETDSGNDGGF
jgi:cytochrome c-type biogenesis protein CcmH